MNNLNWEFFEAYKRLDELCKQVLLSDRGISEYIKEMENEGQVYVGGWERDYKQLKRMRWLRNQIAHEADTIEKNIVTMQDIEWLKEFHVRIMECKDPFSLLNLGKNANKKIAKAHVSKLEKSGQESKQVSDFGGIFFAIFLLILTVVIVIAGLAVVLFLWYFL